MVHDAVGTQTSLRYLPMAAASSPPAAAGDVPSDFRYGEALERPGARRLRAICRRVTGLDPCTHPMVALG